MSHSCPPLFSLQETPVVSSELQDDKWVLKHHLKLAEFCCRTAATAERTVKYREEKQHSTEPLGSVPVLLFLLLVHQEGLSGSCYHMYSFKYFMDVGSLIPCRMQTKVGISLSGQLIRESWACYSQVSLEGAVGSMWIPVMDPWCQQLGWWHWGHLTECQAQKNHPVFHR